MPGLGLTWNITALGIRPRRRFPLTSGRGCRRGNASESFESKPCASCKFKGCEREVDGWDASWKKRRRRASHAALCVTVATLFVKYAEDVMKKTRVFFFPWLLRWFLTDYRWCVCVLDCPVYRNPYNDAFIISLFFMYYIFLLCILICFTVMCYNTFIL